MPEARNASRIGAACGFGLGSENRLEEGHDKGLEHQRVECRVCAEQLRKSLGKRPHRMIRVLSVKKQSVLKEGVVPIRVLGKA
jgi:hypothetical protein